MAGIYSPKNVGKLIIGGAEATETTSKKSLVGQPTRSSPS